MLPHYVASGTTDRRDSGVGPLGGRGGPRCSRIRLSDTRRAYRIRVQGELGHGGLQLGEGRRVLFQRYEHRTRLVRVDVHEGQSGAIDVSAEYPAHGVRARVMSCARPATAAEYSFLVYPVAQLREVGIAE